MKNITLPLIALAVCAVSALPVDAQTPQQKQQLQANFTTSAIALLVDDKCNLLNGAARAVAENIYSRTGVKIEQLRAGAAKQIRDNLKAKLVTKSCVELSKLPKVKNIKSKLDYLTGVFLAPWEYLYGTNAQKWDSINQCTKSVSRKEIQVMLETYASTFEFAKKQPQYDASSPGAEKLIQRLKTQCREKEHWGDLDRTEVVAILQKTKEISAYSTLSPNAALREINASPNYGLSLLDGYNPSNFIALRNTLPKEVIGITMPWAIQFTTQEKSPKGTDILFTSNIEVGFLTDKRFAVNISAIDLSAYTSRTYGAQNFISVNILGIVDLTTYTYKMAVPTTAFITGSTTYKNSKGKLISPNIGQFVLSPEDSAIVYRGLDAGNSIKITTTRMIEGKPLEIEVIHVMADPEGFPDAFSYAFGPKILQ